MAMAVAAASRLGFPKIAHTYQLIFLIRQPRSVRNILQEKLSLEPYQMSPNLG